MGIFQSTGNIVKLKLRYSEQVKNSKITLYTWYSSWHSINFTSIFEKKQQSKLGWVKHQLFFYYDTRNSTSNGPTFVTVYSAVVIFIIYYWMITGIIRIQYSIPSYEAPKVFLTIAVYRYTGIGTPGTPGTVPGVLCTIPVLEYHR